MKYFNKKYQTRVRGMLLGLHVGDSLGATLEFQDARSLNQLHREITGGGPFHWKAGEATDDTDMMICLLESIVRNKRFNVLDCAERYLEWYRSDPVDIGNTVSSALMRFRTYTDPLTSGLAEDSSQGNGSLMRVAPLVLMDPSLEDIKHQASITHAHENCILCDQIFISLLKLAIEGSRKEEIYQNALELSKVNEEIFNKIQGIPSMNWESVKCEGYVIDSLVFSLWAFLKYDSFEDSLVHIVNRGGDADTLGAITGALYGAWCGEDEIPKRWLDKIQRSSDILKLLKSIVP